MVLPARSYSALLIPTEEGMSQTLKDMGPLHNKGMQTYQQAHVASHYLRQDLVSS